MDARHSSAMDVGSDTTNVRSGADSPGHGAPLDALVFDHLTTAALPGDPDTAGHPRAVRDAVFSRVAPTPVSAPVTVAWSPEVADLLGIDHLTVISEDFAQVFSGNRIPLGADPHATVYGGHQFGNWAGQLGDGRAISLGEVRDRHGARQNLQLKGAGPTPFSRGADGRAVLRSSVREFLCSEAMHHLGIPTTRALSLVRTGDDVVRDMLYDGNPRPEPGAVVCRVAPSFLRFGHFQLPAARGDVTLLRQLIEFAIREHFPEIAVHDVPGWFAEVGRRTMALALDWTRVGFVHGVLNTDNMSALGLTIDYGPYGWLESFDPGWTPNTTDASGRRYRFGAQSEIAFWNLVQFATALVPVTGESRPFEEVLDEIRRGHRDAMVAMMAERLGWGPPRPGDGELADELFDLLQLVETDYVIFCRLLVDVPVSDDAGDDDLLHPLLDAYYVPGELTGAVRSRTVDWLRRWGARVRLSRLDEIERTQRMRALNPRFVLRNYLAQEAIDAAERGDNGPLVELLDVLRHPYEDQPGRERFAARRPEWARTKVGCSMLSCSS